MQSFSQHNNVLVVVLWLLWQILSQSLAKDSVLFCFFDEGRLLGFIHVAHCSLLE